jgi:DNA-binding transcriptional regulator LsrR (DeoR family)
MHIGAEGVLGSMVATTEPSIELLTSVARMYYIDEMEQRTIADVFGVSRSTVSRLLSAARDRGIVRVSIAAFDPRDAELERALIDRFGLRRAIVVRTLSRTIESIRQSVGYYAAPEISCLMRPGRAIGVAGGRTLGCLINAVSVAEPANASIIVQLMGHIDPTASRMDAPELSRTLARRLGGAYVGLNAPIYAADRQSRDVFLAHEQIGSTLRRAETLDLALVGIGSLNESVFFARGVLTASDGARLHDAGAVGEVCGRFFDAHGRECDTPDRDRVLSIGLDVLRTCGESIGVTNGADRAPAARAAIAGGIVTGLVIDHRCAEAMLGVAQSTG